MAEKVVVLIMLEDFRSDQVDFSLLKFLKHYLQVEFKFETNDKTCQFNKKHTDHKIINNVY